MEQLPPSARTVLEVLHDGRMTVQGLQSESGLARRTIYQALSHLRQLGLLREQASLQDARQTWYWLKDS